MVNQKLRFLKKNKKLNENRDSTQEKLTKVNTPESIYDFWGNHRKTK